MRRRGERHPRARLHATQVAELRALVAGGMAQVSAASRFGVSQQQVSRIIRREQWRSDV